MKGLLRLIVVGIYAFIILFLCVNTFAEEYQKVKYTVIVRGSQYGEYTMSDWIDDKKVPEFFEFVGIDQKKVEDGLTAWEAAEQYAKDHPPVYVQPSKGDYLSLYNDRLAEADTYLEQYAGLANKTEMEAVKTTLDSKVTSVSEVIATKPKTIVEVVDD